MNSSDTTFIPVRCYLGWSIACFVVSLALFCWPCALLWQEGVFNSPGAIGASAFYPISLVVAGFGIAVAFMRINLQPKSPALSILALFVNANIATANVAAIVIFLIRISPFLP